MDPKLEIFLPFKNFLIFGPKTSIKRLFEKAQRGLNPLFFIQILGKKLNFKQGRRVMRIKLGVLALLFFAVSLLLSGRVWAAEGDIWLEPNPLDVAPGEAFTLNLYADSGTQKLGAFQITINFDSNIIEVDTTQGDNGMEPGADALANNFSNPNNEAGEWGLSGFDVNGKQGNRLHLMVLHFKAKAEGTTNLTINVVAMSNEEGTPFANTNGIGATVNVVTNITPPSEGPKVKLTVKKNMTGGVKISSTPSGINCVDQLECSAEFEAGSTVTLFLDKNHESYIFSWGDACASCGSADTCTITMDADKTCSVTVVGHGATAVSGTSFDVFAVGMNEAMVMNVQPANISPANPPQGVIFPYGFVTFDVQLVETLGGVVATSPSQAQITLRVLDKEHKINAFYKASGDELVRLGPAKRDGDYAYISYTITDNEMFDEDPRSGIIHDPVGAAIEPVENVPSMTEWGMIIFSILALTAGLIYMRRRHQEV